MWGRRKASACRGLGFTCSFVLLAAPGAVAPQDTMALTESAAPEASLRTTLSVQGEVLAFRRAAEGARRRLSNPKCQKLFSEFKDASGRTLQEELDALGQTPASFMGWVLFADGRNE